MIWLLFVCVIGKYLQRTFDLVSPELVTTFRGADLTIEASARVEQNPNEGGIVSVALVSTSSLEPPKCDLPPLMLLSIPLDGNWSEPHMYNFVPNSSKQYIWILNCFSSLAPDQCIKIQFTITDALTGHYSLDTTNIESAFFSLFILYLLIITFNTYKFYKEMHEDAPFALIILISLMYIVSILLRFLFYFVFGYDGVEYKFVLIFSLIFEAGAIGLLVGVMGMIGAAKMDLKEFWVEESEFFGWLAIVAAEFGIGIGILLYYDGAEEIEVWDGLGGKIMAWERIVIGVVVGKYIRGRKNPRIEGFQHIEQFIVGVLLTPVIVYAGYSIIPIKSFTASVLFIRNLPSVISLTYLSTAFTKTSLSGILPFKQHKN